MFLFIHLLSDPCAGKACYGHATGPCNNIDSNGVGICMCDDPDKQIDASGNCVGKFLLLMDALHGSWQKIEIRNSSLGLQSS